MTPEECVTKHRGLFIKAPEAWQDIQIFVLDSALGVWPIIDHRGHLTGEIYDPDAVDADGEDIYDEDFWWVVCVVPAEDQWHIGEGSEAAMRDSDYQRWLETPA